MKRLSVKFYDFICIFICLLGLCFSAVLWISGFVNTAYCEDMDSQKVLYKFDRPVGNLFGVILGVTALYLFFCLIKRYKQEKSEKILLVAVCLLQSILGFALILFGRTMPAADAMSVYAIADSFACGDLSAIHPTASYLSYYPQQIGLVSFYEPILWFLHLLPFEFPKYHLIKCIYVILVDCIILYQYKTVSLLFHDHKTNCVYLILAGTNLPLLFYSSFVYSEIPSFATLSVGLYYLLALLKNDNCEKKTSYLFMGLSFFFLTWSVLLRKNSLVIIIAVVCVVIAKWIQQYKNKLLPCMLLLCLIGSLGILPFVQKIYEVRGQNFLKSGVTATSYFAMGMQEASRGMGWYNGFNFYTYQDTGMDEEATNAIAKDAIRERLQYFKEHPAYALSFYSQKFLSQWTDGTYACRQATLANGGGRSEFLNQLYQGRYSQYLISWCNQYQNLLYLGVLFCFLMAWHDRKQKALELADWLLFIGVFGGFLFHMLWEANSRYIFLYGLLLLPYGANGLAQICHRLQMTQN